MTNREGEMRKYIHVLSIVIRNSFYKASAYRANFFSGLITDFCFNLSRIVFVNILFGHADTLGGWNIHHYQLFFGCSFLAESIYMFFFYNSHTTISRRIICGDMDFLLTKPMAEMFVLSAMDVNLGSGISNFVLGMSFLSMGVNGLDLEIAPGRLALLGFLVLCGSMIYFSLSLMINLLSFWVVNANSVFDLFMNITDLYRYPGDLFPRVVSSVITFVLPLQFIAILPAGWLMGDSGAGSEVGVEVGIFAGIYAAVFMLLGYCLLRRAIGRYSSVGS